MKIKSLLILALVTVSVMSCSVFKPISIVPPFNAAIVNDVTTLGKQVDAMYIKMEASVDKTYNSYVPDYSSGEVLINSIIVRDQARPKSEVIVRQAILYRDLYLKYKGEHQSKNKLNNSEIRIYRQYLQDQLKPLLVSEMSLK